MIHWHPIIRIGKKNIKSLHPKVYKKLVSCPTLTMKAVIHKISKCISKLEIWKCIQSLNI